MEGEYQQFGGRGGGETLWSGVAHPVVREREPTRLVERGVKRGRSEGGMDRGCL